MFERIVERLLFGCRWLLAPLFLGLSIALIALGIQFFIVAYEAIMHVISHPDVAGLTAELAAEARAQHEARLVLTVLAMIDIVLVGSLIVMVMFSGYENFVSRIDTGDASDA